MSHFVGLCFGENWEDNLDRYYEGLEVEPIEFKTNYNNNLRGYIYSYKNDEYKGLAVVSHGLGVGHLQYTCEIEHFAKLGFKVIAFDNTGCARSDGKQINGLPQGIIDLKSCLEFIKTRDDLKIINVSYSDTLGAVIVH